MQTVLFLAAGAAAVAAVATAGLESRAHTWVKTGATLLIALLVGLSLADSPLPDFTLWLAVGLLLAAVGDHLLARYYYADEDDPRRKGLFIAGLAAFLLCHVAYLLAVLLEFGAFPWWLFGVALLPGLLLYLLLWRGMTGYRLPVAVYVLALSAMVAAMLGLWFGSCESFGVLLPVTVGAAAFWLSDALLAVGVFEREKLPRHEGRLPEVLVLILYYLAQLSFGFVVFAF
jgi:uncharacterized membrane protein YhhN